MAMTIQKKTESPATRAQGYGDGLNNNNNNAGIRDTNIDTNNLEGKSSHTLDYSNVQIDPELSSQPNIIIHDSLHTIAERCGCEVEDADEDRENVLLTPHQQQPHSRIRLVADQALAENQGSNFRHAFNPLSQRSIQHSQQNTIRRYEGGNYSHLLPQYGATFDSSAADLLQNYDHPPFAANMSLSYESRAFISDAQYPIPMAHDTQEQDEFKHDEPRYPSPPPPLSENPYTAQPMTATPEQHTMELPELPKDEEDAPPSPSRSKPIPKPDREVTKDANGRYYCAWPGCTEEIKDFNRKCEWSKHMDKHDRPYRCKETGCEKLPGFTYSGGLLRHEREVHGKHGGPKKQLNCPHPNCKRHTGKGFSRQENLNEHLRRVHTDTASMITQMVVEDVTDHDVSPAAGIGMKRKRSSSKGDSDLREEMKRIKAENEELKRKYEDQQAQCTEMMRQLVELQSIASLQHPRIAPQAPMQ